jgi:phenylpropionate dioxygenase-like ring-hydroxylating dioxygenase large terminal subunit
MSTPSFSETLTRVGPGTPMGELMRQYWIPALMSSELEADGPPVRLMLLGEKLIASRDSAGRVGIMDHRCAHRCASLFLGRNEENGLRCVFHGWKFDVEGRCVDMPNVPPWQDYKDRVHARAYRTVERNGLIWTYMGNRAEPPALPQIEMTMVPEEEVAIDCMQRECNWLQVMEGDLDTGHFGFLHLGTLEAGEIADDNFVHHMTEQRWVELDVANKPWGTGYAAHQDAGDRTYWRFANFMFPFWAQNPQSLFADHVDGGAFVPMDDTHTMVFRFHWLKQTPFIPRRRDGGPLPMLGFERDYLPATTDWYGRWRPAANASNDWQLDRAAQRDGRSFTGIPNLFVQDQAVTESAGPILDHAHEHLGPTDEMIARTRLRLHKAAIDLRDKGTVPPGVDDPHVFIEARGGSCYTPKGLDWERVYADQLGAAVRPGLAIAAE